MKLLTIADGYGDSIAVPTWYPNYWKWPKLIGLMSKGVEVINLSRYGAGNEIMANQLKQNVSIADKVIIQWAQPNRLDLMLSNNDPAYWQSVIANDKVYNNNIIECGNNKFWLSSGSKTQAVQDYHRRYISLEQHQLRSQIYVEYAKLILDRQSIDYRFMLVEDSEYLNMDANWICHEPMKGMRDFKTKSNYANLDLGLVQPLPLVAFDFIKQYIMPSIDLQWRNKTEIDAVENMLHRHYQEALKNQNDQI